MMKITRAMAEMADPCGPGLALFNHHFPDGEWEITPESVVPMVGIAPWDWMADNLLSPRAKLRYLRVLAVQRDWYLAERAKVIAELDEHGTATDDMKALMAGIERTYTETKAAAFSAASVVHDLEPTDAV